MIKNLLLTTAVAMTALSSVNVQAADKVTEMNWHYGVSPRSVTYLDNTKGYTDYGFIYIDGETATKFAGNKINGFSVINGIYNGLLPKATYIFTESLDADPYFSTTKKVTKSSLDSTGSSISAWNSDSFTFDEPYTIKAGQGFYVGLSFDEQSSTNYPFAIDYFATTSYTGGFMVAHETSGTALKDIQLEDYTPYYGALGVTLNMSGDNLPQQDVWAYGLYEAATHSDTFDYSSTVYFINRGAQPVNSITYKYKGGDNVWHTETINAASPIEFGKYAGFSVQFPCSKYGVNSEDLEITEVNGEADETPEDNYLSNAMVVFDEASTDAFSRNVLGEEFTGTWCGWCPRGYVGMEYMKDTYTDGSWIGVAVHYGDEMQAGYDYYDVLNNYVSGFPSAMINRLDEIDPSQSELEASYKEGLTKAAPANIVLTAKHDDEKIYVTSDVTFAFDVNPGDFAIEYILREDNVGPYSQYNNYAGGGYGEMGGFEDLGTYASVKYNDVVRARVVYDNPFYNGVSANTTTTHSASFDIPDGVKIDDTNVIAVVVGPNDYICNAKIAMQYAAVNDIISDEANNFAPVVNNGSLSVGNVDAEVYTISGQHVASLRNNSSASLANGLYIVRAGNKAAKVLVK